MEFASLEQEAERKAATHVANMLHTPDKLEKVRIVSHFTFSQPWFALANVKVNIASLLLVSLLSGKGKP